MALTQQEIDDLARAPKKTVTNEGSVLERPAEELIAVNNYALENEVGNQPLHGLRVSKFMTGGAV